MQSLRIMARGNHDLSPLGIAAAQQESVFRYGGMSYPQALGAYEVDHFIPLEIGGSNDLTNLWLEPASPTPGFHQKDQFEKLQRVATSLLEGHVHAERLLSQHVPPSSGDDQRGI